MVLYTTILDSVAIILCCAYLLFKAIKVANKTFYVFCLSLIALGSLGGIGAIIFFYPIQVKIAALQPITAKEALCIDQELTENCTAQKQQLETTFA